MKSERERISVKVVIFLFIRVIQNMRVAQVGQAFMTACQMRLEQKKTMVSLWSELRCIVVDVVATLVIYLMTAHNQRDYAIV